MLSRHRSDNRVPKKNKQATIRKNDAYDPQYDDDERSLDEMVAGIDTTLTPEQRINVDKLKKQMSGGPASQKIRSEFRDTMTPDTMKGTGNYFPKLAENADALIDYALSHIPVKAGPRRTRHRQRQALKFEAKRLQDQIAKIQIRKATLKKQATRKKDNDRAKAYRAEALVINAAREAKLSASLASASL